MVSNPYWEEIQDLRRKDMIVYDPVTRVLSPVPGIVHELNAVVSRYSPTISDPPMVEFIVNSCSHGVVLADAGNGYWAHLISQYKKAVTAYDRDPPFFRQWHKVQKINRTYNALSGHDRETLLFISPVFPYARVVTALRQYRGPRLIIVCNQPESVLDLADALDRDWQLTAKFAEGTTRFIHPSQVYVYRRVSAMWTDSTMLLPTIERGPL